VYKVVPIKGAGLGLVATSDIVAGAVILRERPLVLVPRAYNMRSMNEGTRTLVSAVNTMHPENQRLFYALKNVEGKTVASEEEGILDTNAYTCGAHNGRYGGVARDVSRANHSCRPNAEHCFDTATLTQSLRAFRDIPAGEEITVTYIDWSLKCEERQDRLRCRYSFNCTCKSCQLTGLERMESD
ncbi:SET domain-containing protein, partial [Polyporus arcularius HHB13444]